MKSKEIAKTYGFDVEAFDFFVMRQSVIKVSGLMSNVVDDKDVQAIVDLYKNELAKKEAAKTEKLLKEQEKLRKEQEREQAAASVLISSGFNFEGYRIVKYSGFISGDDAIQINRDDLFIKAGQNLTDAISLIRIQALKELKEAAYDLGCNAVIGVDFDYITFDPQTANATGGTTYQPYVVCVTANGNAVVIEKNN